MTKCMEVLPTKACSTITFCSKTLQHCLISNSTLKIQWIDKADFINRKKIDVVKVLNLD